MNDPVHVWVPSIGVSGLAVYTGDKFPRWRGSMFAGGMTGEQLVRLTMEGRQVMNVEQLVQRIGRIRDVRQGPDGYVYLAIEADDGGSPTPILRLEPAEASSTSQGFAEGFAQEFAGQFGATARKLVALAGAMPPERYSWRPMEGVSSVAEVFMHIAHYNYLYPHENLGVEPPAAAAGHATWEETVTEKAEVVALLEASMEHVRRVAEAMDAAEMEGRTSLYGRDVARWAVLFQLISHMNEHLGQSIAYARMNQVVPPWSR
jgi:uncharacterized damage-inducible protein DinB